MIFASLRCCSEASVVVHMERNTFQSRDDLNPSHALSDIIYHDGNWTLADPFGKATLISRESILSLSLKLDD